MEFNIDIEALNALHSGRVNHTEQIDGAATGINHLAIHFELTKRNST
jgi:hypothetical protein